MSTDKGCERKDPEDIQEGIRDSANISIEIAQNRFQNAITGTQSSTHMVDEHIKMAAEKTKNAACDVKKETHNVAKGIKKTAINVARTVHSPRKKI